ncbi:hypothetical protein GRJ2_003368500 [Grus japonensis]|uniref:Ubiquitin carboxyl-terminal hydrolase 4 n=1 Tax=Grus japonensis TaxID=30415 RepID=A0ABC9YG37_GRUJA
MWESMGGYLETFSPPVVWNFTPEQLQDPDKMVEYLKGKCCGDSKETQLTALCWALATIYQTLLDSRQHHPGEREQTHRHCSYPSPRNRHCSRAKRPTRSGISRPYTQEEIHKERDKPLSLWRRLLSSVRERYPFSEDVLCQPGKWTTMERGIQYLRELAVREMVYYDLDKVQVPTDPDEVQCTCTMWQKFVRSAPSSYANSLAVIDWKSEEAPAVDEVAGQLRQYEESLSSSLISALKKLSREVWQLKGHMSYSPSVQTHISAIRSIVYLCSKRI